MLILYYNFRCRLCFFQSLCYAKLIKVLIVAISAGYPQGDIDLGVVRLCYQAFLPDSNKRFTRIVQPIVSKQIFDKSEHLRSNFMSRIFYLY